MEEAPFWKGVKVKFGPKPKDGESTGLKTRRYKKKKEGGVPFGFAQDKESRPRTEAKNESEGPQRQGVVWQPAGEGEAETLPADLKKVT